MDYKIELHETAEEELWEAIDWYDQQKNKLGREFAKAIEEFVAKIKTQPFLFPKIKKNKRKAVLKRFPYIIVFEIIGETIFILAIFHTKRNPKIWQKRL